MVASNVPLTVLTSPNAYFHSISKHSPARSSVILSMDTTPYIFDQLSS